MSDKINQVEFANWTDKNAPKQYWSDISTIAMFIASALQHPSPRCNSMNPRISTILVHQHKEKFGAVNVYCHLADTSLVLDKWIEQGKSGEPTPDFIKSCLIHDANVYHGVYMKMIKLVPHYRKMIVIRADYRELTFDNINDLNEWIDVHGEFSTKQYDCQNKEELMTLLCEICNFNK